MTDLAQSQPGGAGGGGRRYLIARVSVALILCVWVISGYGKVTDLNSFVDTVTEHRVLDQALFGWLWLVGPTELLMGLLLVFVAGSELTKPFGRVVLVVSMGAVIGLSVYLMLVDDAILRTSGCGCLDALTKLGRVDSGIHGSERAVKLTFNGVLVGLHVVALGQPLLARGRSSAHGESVVVSDRVSDEGEGA